MNDEQDFDNNPGFSFEGQEVLSEATPAPPPPFPHNPSPALGPASALGQTMGAMGGGLVSGLMAALPWSQPEVAELARLTEAENQVKRDMMNGSLHPQDADRFLSLLAPRLNSLDQKRKKHQADQAAQAEQAAMEQAQKQAAQQEAIRSIHMQTRAGNAQKLLHTIVDPVTLKVAHLYPMNDKGDLKPLFEEKGDAISQELKLPTDPDLAFNLQEPPGTEEPPELGQLAQQRRQQLVDQFPAGHEHVMTIEEGGKQRQVAFTKNANGTWSGGEGPLDRGERDNLGRLTSPAGTDTGLAELKRRALQVAGQPPPANAPAWMQHAYHDKYNGILQKLVGHNLLQSGHEKDLVRYQEKLKQAAEQKTQLEKTHHELQTQLAHEKAALRRVGLGDVDEKEIGKEYSKNRGEIDRQFHALAKLYGDPEKKAKMTDEQLQMYHDLDSEEKRQKESIGLTYDFFRFRKQIGGQLSALRAGQGATPTPPSANPAKPLELQGPPYSGATGGKPATASSAEDEAIQALLRKEIRLPDPSQLREGSIKNIPRGMRSNE